MKSSFSITDIKDDRVIILDNNMGGRSVTNDAENVVEYLYSVYGDRRVFYIDDEIIIMENIQHDYFIWEEKNLIDQNQNSLKNEKFVKENSIIETKNDLTQKDWKDITDPKLREKAYQKAYRQANKEKIRLQKKAWCEDNKDKIKVQRKTYLEVNKEKINTINKNWRDNNKDKVKLFRKSWRDSNKDKVKNYYQANKEKIKQSHEVWIKNNKGKINSYIKNKKKTDIQFKLRYNLRSRLNTALKSNYKSGSAVKNLGCTIEQLKQHLESKFQPGMSWDNWTTDGWHIDHIKPLASFDLTDKNQLLEACHYTNLQPLWAIDNLSKSDNII